MLLTRLPVLLLLAPWAVPLPVSAQAVADRVKQTTLPSGWRVDCLADEVHATRECFAAKFGSSPGAKTPDVPFRVVFVDTLGPLVRPGFNTFPGRTPTVRVDDNPPISEMRSPELIEQLKVGTLVRAEYHVWPTGAERMTLDATGFAEAYELLLANVTRR